MLPACLVDVGGADAEAQAIRQTLLERAILADLAFAESLIATEYAQFLQGQAAEVRSCLPSSPPEPFRAKRYFSNLDIEVCQRDADEQIEHFILHLPVHPRDGGVDPAEHERRAAWIQNLSVEQIQQVDTLVHDKWQVEAALAPAWTSSYHQKNCMRFAGSAQMLALAGSWKASPMAEVASFTCLGMLVLAGSPHGRSRDLEVPPHGRSWLWLPKLSWTKASRLHNGFYRQLRGI